MSPRFANERVRSALRQLRGARGALYEAMGDTTLSPAKQLILGAEHGQLCRAEQELRATFVGLADDELVEVTAPLPESGPGKDGWTP